MAAANALEGGEDRDGGQPAELPGEVLLKVQDRVVGELLRGA